MFGWGCLGMRRSHNRSNYDCVNGRLCTNNRGLFINIILTKVSNIYIYNRYVCKCMYTYVYKNMLTNNNQ